MRFYYEDSYGDWGYFSENNLIKAIYTTWNIEASLSLLNEGLQRIDFNRLEPQMQLVFCPFEDNEFNSELLQEFGYYMKDGDGHRDIRRITDDVVERYDWSEVRQLV